MQQSTFLINFCFWRCSERGLEDHSLCSPNTDKIHMNNILWLIGELFSSLFTGEFYLENKIWSIFNNIVEQKTCMDKYHFPVIKKTLSWLESFCYCKFDKFPIDDFLFVLSFKEFEKDNSTQK